MRRKRGRTVDVEEGESYYVSMTDMMVGVIFIFIIMLSYFAFEFRATTAKLTSAVHPETAALLQTAANLERKDAAVEVDRAAGVVCLTEATLGLSQSADGRRCFAFDSQTKSSKDTAASQEAQRNLLAFLDADLRDVGAPPSDSAAGALTFRAEDLFAPDSSELSVNGVRIAGDVAHSLVRRLPCLSYDPAGSAECGGEGGPKLAVVNVLSQGSFDAFKAEGRQAASLALQRSVAFHRALTAAQPKLSSLRNSPAGAPGSQPLLRVSSSVQSQDAAPVAGAGQTITLQFVMNP